MVRNMINTSGTQSNSKKQVNSRENSMLFFNALISGRNHHVQLQHRGAIRNSDFSIYVFGMPLFDK